MNFFSTVIASAAKQSRRIGSLFLCLAVVFSLVACGGGTNPEDLVPEGNSVHVGNLPDFFFSELGDGVLSATLDVYGPDGNLEHSQNLQINENTGEIFSSSFNLPTGFTYTFIVTFLYSENGGPELPIGFVVKIAATEGGSLALFWQESEVVAANGQLSPDISASVSATTLPNLDSDGDGYDNFSEFREGSDPTNANDIPVPPALIESHPDLNTVDFIEMRLVFQDATGISNIEAVGDRVCGFYEWKVTDVTPDGRTKELRAKFNLHAHADIGDTITFNILVSDVLGLSETYPITVNNLSKPDAITSDSGHDLDLPEIAILTPHVNETVSGTIQVHAKACDEDGINYMTVEGFATELHSTNGELIGNLDTRLLGDQQQPITFLATSPVVGGGNKVGQKDVLVNVSNNVAIKIDLPHPSQVLSDGFMVAAHVDKNLLPNVANLFIESITNPSGSEVFGLNQLKFDVNSLPEAFTGQIYNTSNVDNVVFTIKYVAVTTDGGRQEREVRYEISNKPVIERFRVGDTQEPRVCIQGGGVLLEWLVTNVGGEAPAGESAVTIDGTPQTLSGTSSFGESSFTCKSVIILSAKRWGTNQSTGATQTYRQDSTLNLSVLVASQTPDPTRAILPSEFLVQFSGAGVDASLIHWKVDIDDPETAGVDYQGLNAEGLTIDSADIGTVLQGLPPLKMYRITLKLLDSDHNKVISSLPTPIWFLMGDENLVGWYRFDDASEFGLDSSGEGNDGNASTITSGGLACMPNLDDCAEFNGTSSYIRIDGFSQTNSMTIDLWVNFGAGVTDGVILSKADQFEIAVDSTGLRFTLEGSFGAKDVSVNLDGSGPVSITAQPNTWYHVIAKYDAALGLANQVLQIGGVSAIRDYPDTLNQNTSPVYLGRNSSGGYFNGLLDEIRIYDAVVP